MVAAATAGASSVDLVATIATGAASQLGKPKGIRERLIVVGASVLQKHEGLKNCLRYASARVGCEKKIYSTTSSDRSSSCKIF